MLKLRKIVYATDFSTCSENAFPIAVGLAARYGAELHMLHAIVLHADDPHDPAHHFPEPDELYQRMRRTAEASMASAAEGGEMPEVSIVRAQVRGISPAPVILEYAEEQGADLIVMGTHGRRGLRHLLLGSVAEEVVRLAECAVLTVREDAATDADGFRQILVPMDYSQSSEAALRYAREIGSVEGAKLHLLHVLEVGTYPDFYFPVQASQMFDMPELKKKAVENLQQRLERDGGGIEAEVQVELGHPAQNIVEYAERLGIDLIVIASHGRTGLERALLGSVAEGVVRRSKTPVLIVKPFAETDG